MKMNGMKAFQLLRFSSYGLGSECQKGRESTLNSRSVMGRRQRITLLKISMSKKSSSWSRGCAKDRKGWWSEYQGTYWDSQSSNESWGPATQDTKARKEKKSHGRKDEDSDK